MRVINNTILQGIQTTYLGPTTHRPARIKAHAYKKWAFYYWDHELGTEENHHRAAIGFCTDMNWADAYDLVCGSNHNQKGYHYVLVPKEREAK